MGNCVPTRPVVVVEPVPVPVPVTVPPTTVIYPYGLDSPEYIEAMYPKPRREDFSDDSSYATAVQSREIAIPRSL